MKFNLNTENINYLKFTYKDKDNFAHCIKAAIKFIGEYEILACTKAESTVYIDTPQEINLGIACDNGLYTAKTTLKKTEEKDSYLLFSILKPEEMDYQQNREYFRVKFQEDANIIYQCEGEEKKISAIIYDISANGVRIELDEQINFPEQVKLLLFLPQKNIDIQAKYIRNDDEDQIIKASFQFIDISQSDLDYISQICLRKQIEDRRKNLL